MKQSNARFYQTGVNYLLIGERDPLVIQGVNLAIWLYIDKDYSMASACKVGAKKYSIPVSRVTKCFRHAIPAEVISKNSRRKIPEYVANAIRAEKIAQQKDKQHFQQI